MLELDRKLGSALLALVAEEGWHAASMGRIAQRAGVPLAEAWPRSPGRLAVLARYAAAIDAAVLEGTVPPAPGESVRDRLFDLVMRRFDLLVPDRAGLAALPRELATDPFAALAMGAVGLRSMAALLEGAGVSSDGPAGLVRAHGLMAVWLQVSRTWVTDESADLGTTMAALDRTLAQAERFAGMAQVMPRERDRAPVEGDDAPFAGAETGPA